MSTRGQEHIPAVVTLGEVMALLIAPESTPLGAASQFDLSYAGAEATVAVGLARLGHETSFVGRLGDDEFGSRIRNELRGEGVRVGALQLIAGQRTGLLIRDCVTDRPISVAYYRAGSAASTLTVDDIPSDTIRGARVLHVTGITAMLSESALATTLHAMETARDSGTVVVLDPNVRHKLGSADQWRTVIDLLARRADVVLVGASEAAIVTDTPPDWFHARGAQIVVVKDGRNGAIETDGQSALRQVATETRVLDAVGAGDAFAVGWIGGWLRRVPPEERMREAVAVAALAIGARGDITGLPDARALRRALRHESDMDR